MPPFTHYRRYQFLSEPGLLTVGWLIAAVVGTGLSLAAGRAAGRWLGRLRR